MFTEPKINLKDNLPKLKEKYTLSDLPVNLKVDKARIVSLNCDVLL